MAETVKKSRIVSDDNLEESLMEEFNMRLKSCMSQDNLQEDCTNGLTSSEIFIQNERNYYEEPINNKQNGHVYENIKHQDLKTDLPTPTTNNYVEMNNTIIITPQQSNDEIEKVYEEIDCQKEIKSVKDRMLLSTDTAPCLLFTQTVTSPMLTPSEENIDFLKAFQQPVEENQEVIYENLKENIYENVEEIKESERIYQNLEEINQNVSSEECENHEVIEDVIEEINPIYDNAQIPAEKVQVGHIKGLEENAESSPTEPIEVIDIIETSDDIAGDEICDINVEVPAEENEQEASNQNEIPFEEIEIIDISDETADNEFQSVNLMKQISKFENIDSTQVVESYVETTTFESSSPINDKGSLKKKKSKKSRKEEKENISVTNSNNLFNNNSEESFYNVNVKNLCKSFGDLTKIEDNYDDNNRVKKRMRTKSLSDAVASPNNKLIENVFFGVSVRALKSSCNKFDALQKKNVLHVRSSDSSKAQEKFNGAAAAAQIDTTTNCKACDKAVFQMELIKAERAVWHKNCFRCKECNKQLSVDTYQSHEATLYCKPHFKALFAPKVVDEDLHPKSRKPQLEIRENQPLELPPDVVRASDKPDLGLEELTSLNVKERFQVFEHYQQNQENQSEIERNINVKRSPSILSKLARFQAKGMDIGVADDSLNGIPIEESSSEEEEVEVLEGEDADLVRAKRVQKEKPFHFTGMSDVKSKWEHGAEQNSKDERREERKQEIQTIRNRLFMGKQVKMKEAYQQAVMESESCTNLRKNEPVSPIEAADTKSIKERFEKGEIAKDISIQQRENEEEVYESEISKNSRSLFLELDANASKAPQITPLPTPKLDVKKAREAYLSKTATSDDVVKSAVEPVEEFEIRTADLQEKFKFFETFKEPEKEKKQFRITPPREGQIKAPTPDREVYRDPDVVRSEEYIEDSVIAKETHTATKMLNKFRQMEEDLNKEQLPSGPKPLKCFTPPPEPTRRQSNSSGETASDSEQEDSEGDDDVDNTSKMPEDLIEAQKAARAKQLRAKFEKWEAQEIEREQRNAVNIIEDCGDEQSQVESTRSLRARFESMRETSNAQNKTPRVKVNRFV